MFYSFQSSLEQFDIFPILSLFLFKFDLSFTNSSWSVLLALFFYFILFFLSVPGKHATLKFNRIFYFYKNIYNVVLNMVLENAGKKGIFMFPYMYTLFVFILFINLFGMVPYNFTATSHLIFTFFLSFVTFLAINIIGFKIHKIEFFNLFLPQGAPFLLSPLLIPIETISYVFRVISLSVRLFANMMAGHTLLKVIAGFAWVMACKAIFVLNVVHIIPLLVVFLLVGLELGVAFIQAYVFTILSCIYLSDVISLH